jgi:hypothetical protein
VEEPDPEKNGFFLREICPVLSILAAPLYAEIQVKDRIPAQLLKALKDLFGQGVSYLHQFRQRYCQHQGIKPFLIAAFDGYFFLFKINRPLEIPPTSFSNARESQSIPHPK